MVLDIDVTRQFAEDRQAGYRLEAERDKLRDRHPAHHWSVRDAVAGIVAVRNHRPPKAPRIHRAHLAGH